MEVRGVSRFKIALNSRNPLRWLKRLQNATNPQRMTPARKPGLVVNIDRKTA